MSTITTIVAGKPMAEANPVLPDQPLSNHKPAFTRKPKAILIAVSDGFGGYGDFLFALKMVDQLRKQYRDAGKEIPPIYLVTQQTGKEQIQKLKGDVEFGVDVFTPNELKDKVDSAEIDAGTVLEGPVFQTALMDSINTALSNIVSKIPLFMLPEYGYSDATRRNEIQTAREYRANYCSRLEYAGLIYSGFKTDADECGILLSDSLVHPAPPDDLIKQLDPKIHKPIFGSGLVSAAYQKNTELAMQYSHDTYIYPDVQKPAFHFLNVHCELCKTSAKNQDVVMIGGSRPHKMLALQDMLEKLKADGFKRISFYDAETEKEEVLYDSGEVPAGKSYRVIYARGMSHVSMLALTALSGPLVGSTGDQSFGEALSANKLMVYECLKHKVTLIQNYDAAIAADPNASAAVIDTMRLLRNAKTDEEYRRLGELIRDPKTREQITQCNQGVLKQFDYMSHIIHADEAYEANLVKKIHDLLISGHPHDALKILVEHRSRISFEDLYNDESLIAHAQAANPNGHFVAYYRIYALLKEGKAEQAIALLESHPIYYLESYGKGLMEISLNHDPQGIYWVHCLSLLLKDANESEAIKLLTANWQNKNIAAVYRSKSLIDQAILAKADHFLEKIYAIQLIGLLKAGQIEDALALYIKEEQWFQAKTDLNGKELLEYVLELDTKGIVIQHVFELLIRKAIIPGKEISESQTILSSFIQHKRASNLISLLDKGAELVQIITERTPRNPLLSFYYKYQVMQQLYDGKEAEAVGVIRAHADLLDPNTYFSGTLADGSEVQSTLIGYATAKDRRIFVAFCKELQIYGDIKSNSNFTYKRILMILKESTSYIDLESEFDGKSLIQHAKERLPVSQDLITYYNQWKMAHVLKEGNEGEALKILKENPKISLTSLFRGTLSDGSSVNKALTAYAVDGEMREFLRVYITQHLKAKRSREVVSLLESSNGNSLINFEFDLGDGQSLLSYAIKADPTGKVLDYYHKTQAMQFLCDGNEADAIKLLKDNSGEVKLNESLLVRLKDGTTFRGTLINYALEQKRKEFLTYCIRYFFITGIDLAVFDLLKTSHGFINFEFKIGEQSLIDYAKENYPKGPVVLYYYQHQIMQFLKEGGNEEKALELLKEHACDIFSDFLGTLADGTEVSDSIYEYALKNNRTIFLKGYNQLKIYKCIKNNGLYGYQDTVSLIKTTKPFVDLDFVIDGKSLIEHARDRLPGSAILVDYYNKLKIVQFLRENRQDKAIKVVEENPNLTLTDMFKGVLPDQTAVESSLMDYAKANNRAEFIGFAKGLKIYQRLKINDFYAVIDVQTELKNSPIYIDLETKFDGTSLIEHIRMKLPSSKDLLMYYYQRKMIQLFKENKDEDALKLWEENPDLSFAAVFKGTLADGTAFNSSLVTYAEKHGKSTYIKTYNQLKIAESLRSGDSAASATVKTYLKETKSSMVPSLLFFPHYVAYQLAQYKPKKKATHVWNRDAGAKLSQALITSPDICDRNALIGLLLLIRKDIASEYKWFSPRKGFFFGSSLYSICEDTLKDLGLALNTMTLQDEKRYFAALNGAMQKVDAIKTDPYIIAKLTPQGPFPSLAEELPVKVESAKSVDKVGEDQPVVVINQETADAKKAMADEPFPEELAILRGKKEVGLEKTILRTPKGLYRLSSPKLIGKGGLGLVYQAQFYSLEDEHVKQSAPIAIKMMPSSQSKLLGKECMLFSKSYPGLSLVLFEQGGKTYLAMPLFPGVALDKYLAAQELPQRNRLTMALSLLKNLKGIHANGVIYNDIRPKNLIYDPSTKEMHLIDFGCAEELGVEPCYAGIDTAKYAIEYMSPEYVLGTTTSKANDVYSMTLSLAEILGVDKRKVVQERMDKALAGIVDEGFKENIKKAFDSNESLNAAIFSYPMHPYKNSLVFDAFIKNYVKQSYDFSLYEKQLGSETVTLLDAMQSQDPSRRPLLEDCVARLEKQAILIDNSSKTHLLEDDHEMPEKQIAKANRA